MFTYAAPLTGIHCITMDTLTFCTDRCFEEIYSLNILFIFRKRGREREKHQCVVASCAPPTGDLGCNPGMCPDWELNQ